MAKWGHGDPRWIVEERPDATNVNNWHWTERDASEWSINKLKSLLTNLKMDTDSVKCLVSSVDKCEGEAFVHNRKGKLIFFYEWKLDLKWEGHTTFDITQKSEGVISVLNFGEEYDVLDILVEVAINKSNAYDEMIKDFLSTSGKEIIETQLAIYVADLKDEYSRGMILPLKQGTVNKSANTPKLSAYSGNNRTFDFNPTFRQNAKYTTSDLTINEKFLCSKEDLYRCLTDIELVKAFTHGVVKMESVTGGSFELFGGNVCGKFVELIPCTRIVQTWRFQGWPHGHFSEVCIDLVDRDGYTEVKLLQKNVPEEFSEATRENWHKYYWDPIKRTFGYGYFIFSTNY